MLPITRRLLASAPRRLQTVSLRPNLALTTVARASTPSITRGAFSTFSKASFAATLSKDKAFTADKYPHLQRNQEFKKVLRKAISIDFFLFPMFGRRIVTN